MYRRVPLIEDIKRCGVYYIVLSACAALGLCLGFAAGNRTALSLNAADLRTRTVAVIFYSGRTGAGIFFSSFFSSVCACAVIIAFCINIYMMPLAFVYVVYRGYAIGCNALVFLRNYGFGGSLFIIIVYIPIQLLLTACVILIAGLYSDRCVAYRHRGAFCFSRAGYEELLQTFGVILGINAAVCLAECILFSIFAGSLLMI